MERSETEEKKIASIEKAIRDLISDLSHAPARWIPVTETPLTVFFEVHNVKIYQSSILDHLSGSEFLEIEGERRGMRYRVNRSKVVNARKVAEEVYASFKAAKDYKKSKSSDLKPYKSKDDSEKIIAKEYSSNPVSVKDFFIGIGSKVWRIINDEIRQVEVIGFVKQPDGLYVIVKDNFKEEGVWVHSSEVFITPQKLVEKLLENKKSL